MSRKDWGPYEDWVRMIRIRTLSCLKASTDYGPHWCNLSKINAKCNLFILQRIVVGPSESKSKTSGSTPDAKANRVVVTKASSSGKPSNRVVIGSLPEAITPSRLKELLQGVGPIQVQKESSRSKDWFP